MHISSLTIRNFRNFRNAKLKFQDGINTIIGENGSGKTNLFLALRLLIDSSMPRYVNFNSSDFNRGLGNWAGHWIILALEFDGLDYSEEAQALAIQSNGQMGTISKGSYSVYFRPNFQFRKELFDYSQTDDKTSEGLQEILDRITINDYEAIYLCRGEGDFSNESIYKQYVGDFDTIDFPNPENKEEQVYGTYLPREINIHQEVSCTFIKALRDVESDLRSYSNNPLLNLLRGKEKTVEVAKQDDIIKKIDELNDQISSLDEVKEVKTGIDSSIKDAVGTTYAPNIDIKSELPNEMEKLFQSLKLWVGDPDEDGYMGRIWELSLGGANLIYLSLKLLEYERTKTDKIANFLLIEEPEAHIHTHIQKTLFNNLKHKSTQVIISTHSTHISSVSKIRSINILQRSIKEALVFNPANGLNDDEIIRLERYLDAVRSPLLFAKGVILVEGDAEQILIPELFKVVFGIALDEVGISIINIGSTGFENVARIFHALRVRKNCAIITDLDKSIIQLPVDPKDDDDYQKHYRASQKSGEERQQRLEAFCKDNDYINTYYAENTFEVDFASSGNLKAFENCVEKIYTKPTKVTTVKDNLNNSSVDVYGEEVLSMASYFGKGWLALLISEAITWESKIPQYILEAIAFAAKHINLTSLAKSASYRLKSYSVNGTSEDKVLADQLLSNNFDSEKLIQEFTSNFSEDQLAKFIALL